MTSTILNGSTPDTAAIPMITDQPVLVIICGPTAAGKTAASLTIAKALNTEIISADSRQFYKELCIGTARPAAGELSQVRHHFIGNLSIGDTYNIGMFEKDALDLLSKLFEKYSSVIMVGGSGLYIHAICHGIDFLPESDGLIRDELNALYQSRGIFPLQEKLKEIDPEYFKKVDLNNPVRLIRAIEVTMVTGKPYSSFRKQQPVKRNFRIIKTGIDLPRRQLYHRIDQRVDDMIARGLVEEARRLLPFRSLNALNTVGYKELFDYFDKKISLPDAIELIKRNSRRYAKRQLTWFRKDEQIKWFGPEDTGPMLEYIQTRHD